MVTVAERAANTHTPVNPARIHSHNSYNHVVAKRQPSYYYISIFNTEFEIYFFSLKVPEGGGANREYPEKNIL